MQAVVICTCLAIVGGIIGIIIALYVAAFALILLGSWIILLCRCFALCCGDDCRDAISQCEEGYGECVVSCLNGFWSNIECVAGYVYENLDLCFCTWDPDDA